MANQCLFTQSKNKVTICGVANPCECSKLKKQQGYTNCVYVQKTSQK